MTKFDSIKNMSLEDMAKAIMELSSECSSCAEGCVVGDYDCLSCTLSRLKEVVE